MAKNSASRKGMILQLVTIIYLFSCQMKKHIALFDVAYHGVCSGNIDDDCYSIRYFATLGVEMLVGQSFSKNFTMYGERVGALHIVCSSPLVAQNITRFFCSVLRPVSKHSFFEFRISKISLL